MTGIVSWVSFLHRIKPSPATGIRSSRAGSYCERRLPHEFIQRRARSPPIRRRLAHDVVVGGDFNRFLAAYLHG
jgi:hypothetical protein